MHISFPKKPLLFSTSCPLPDYGKKKNLCHHLDKYVQMPMWENLEDARKAIEYGMECCDILKISDNELTFMTGEKDYDKGAVLLQQKYQIPLVCVTLGKDGSRAYYKGLTIKAEPFLQKNTIETTGAGDTFTGCMLNTVLDAHIFSKETSSFLKIMSAPGLR